MKGRGGTFYCVEHDVSWSGLRMCHCEACGLLFTSPSAFDAHRTGSPEHRQCSTQKLQELKPGIWGTPGNSDRFWQRSEDGNDHS